MQYSQAIMRLQHCGFTQEQVEAIVAYGEAARKELATVHDLRLVESQLKNEIQQVKSELKTEIQQVKTEIHKLENRLTLRMGAMAIFIVGVLGAMKFFA